MENYAHDGAARTFIGDDRRAVGELGVAMGQSVLSASAEQVVMKMPVEGNRQPFGLLHGGASGALVEAAASVAANLHARECAQAAGLDPQHAGAVGVNLSVTHIAGKTSGAVTACASALHRGRTLATYRVDIRDEADKLIASGQLTCAIRLPQS